MDKDFDVDQARKFLQEREVREKEERESERTVIIKAVIKLLKGIFHDQNVEVYLVGSVTQPYQFYPHSDIDIVVKNFHGDRFDLWTKLEGLINRKFEIILFENCHFQDHVIENGLKVL